MNKSLIAFLLLSALLWSQEPKPGSIAGVVREASTGVALPGVNVYVDRGSPKGLTATTDSDGRYSFPEVPPGEHRVTAEGRRVLRGFPPTATRSVNLFEGQAMTDLRFAIVTSAEVSGRVVDQNKEPVAGAMVLLVGREYSLGTMRYVFGSAATTDDEGKYTMSVRPGRTFLLMVQKRAMKMDALSDAPAEIKLRKPSYVTTFFPGVPKLEAAAPLAFSPGEKRDGVDLRILRSPSYCLEGVAQSGSGAGGHILSISDRQPTSGAMGDGAMYVGTPSAKTEPDGRFRICGLYPGTYSLMARSEESDKPAFYGTTEVTVLDRDVRNVVVVAQPSVRIAGEVVWHGEAPDPPLTEQIAISLQPMTRAYWRGEMNDARVSIPGQFVWPSVLVDSYAVRMNRIPDGVYVKELSYGDQNLLAEPLRAGIGDVGAATLRVVLARDGGRVVANVADKDGVPVADSRVLILPVSIASEAAMSAAILAGQSDQAGAWQSRRIAPGKYYVVALERPHDNSPESIGKLWSMRTRFKEIELGPGGSVTVPLAPLSLQ